uniref:Uncharacterized protein n=1 Tax=Arion vulgaris TaxID=1028688 RepID=A0A0B7AU65_9EUPU
MLGLTVFCACLVVCSGWLLSKIEREAPANPLWNGLKVRWDNDPSKGYFSLPRTASEALAQNFVKVSDCDQRSSWGGARYVKDNDYTLTLLYDINGYIAGIQTGIPKNLANGFPIPSLRPPFISDGDRWVITAYFTDPDAICRRGRSAEQFRVEGTGTNLYIQNGSSPTFSFKIPLDESGMAGTKWIEGKCFKAMGKHYWYNLSLDMKETDMFPAFLMFHKGKLQGFGWAMTTSLSSKTYEHPPAMVYPFFMKEVPTFLPKVPVVSTLHIYMTDTPLAHVC